LVQKLEGSVPLKKHLKFPINSKLPASAVPYIALSIAMGRQRSRKLEKPDT
jgi:hypothetical protein